MLCLLVLKNFVLKTSILALHNFFFVTVVIEDPVQCKIANAQPSAVFFREVRVLTVTSIYATLSFRKSSSYFPSSLRFAWESPVRRMWQQCDCDLLQRPTFSHF